LGYLVNLPQIERDQSGGGICSGFSSGGGISFKPPPLAQNQSGRISPARGLAITTALARRESQVSVFAGQVDCFSDRDTPAE